MLDPLEDGLGDPAPLAAVLADPAVEVVVHAGRQDVAILRRAWNTTFANVFDTQIAAGFAGFSAQAGYTGLLHDVLKIRLEKSASFTRWDARPLTPEQLRYAREDVEHLLPLAAELRRRLERARAAGMGARGVRGDRRGDGRARSRRGLAPAAAGLRAGPALARAGARAGRLARAHRRRRGSPARRGAARPDAGRARQARAEEPEGAGPDPRCGARRDPPPRARHPRRRGARSRRPGDPPGRGRSARDGRRRRPDDRAGRGAGARTRTRRPGSRTS